LQKYIPVGLSAPQTEYQTRLTFVPDALLRLERFLAAG
ncbi:uncharacterized protein METZ01_LOCUS461669, partial [marine metagenome]